MIASADPIIEAALTRAFAAADYVPVLPPPAKLRPHVKPVPLDAILFHIGVLTQEVADLTRTTAANALPALRIARPDMLSDQTPLAGLLHVTPEGGCILVRANDPIVRRRFSAAHELGHFLLHFPPESLVDDEMTDDEPGAIGDDNGDEDDGGEGVPSLDERERQANADLKRARADVQALDKANGRTSCPTCGHVLTPEHLVTEKTRRQRLEKAAIDARAAAAKALQAAAAELDRLRARCGELERRREKLDKSVQDATREVRTIGDAIESRSSFIDLQISNVSKAPGV